MADARSFLLLDAVGAPLTSASPSFVDYRDRASNPRTPPSITHLGGGVYTYTPSDADETTGTVALVDAGSSSFPRYDSKAIHLGDNSNQFWAFHIETAAGALWSGAAPTVGVYRDKLGNALTPPTLLSIAAGAYLYALTPSTVDVTADVAVRFDLPAGASTPYLNGDALPVVTGSGGTPPVYSVGLNNRPETIAAKALMEYLRLFLPPKVAELNTLRAAALQTPGVGTGSAVGWLITSGMRLRLSATSRDATPTVVTLPTGSNVTATAIASAINTTPVPGLLASVDASGRLVVTSTTAPTSGPSGVFLQADSTGGNAALGWDAGGEHMMTSPIKAPTHRGVRDGYPTNAPDMGSGFWVVLGDRDARPWPSAGEDMRRGECDVHFVVELFNPSLNANSGISREPISACLWAVREVLQTNVGRQLNRGAQGDIVRVDLGVTRIAGRPFSFTNTNSPNVTFDVAALEVTVRTFQRSTGA